MNDRQTRVYETWRRILMSRETLGKLAPEAPAVLDRLEALLDEIEVHRKQQSAIRVSFYLTTARYHLDQVRTEQMLPLARLARRLFAGASGIEAALRVPHKRAPTDELLAAAEAMVKALHPHRTLLRNSNIDPARIDRLRTDTRLLRKQFRAAYAASADRAAPTRRLPALFAAARLEVDMLAAFVGAQRDREITLGWKHATRVHKRMGRPKRPRGAPNTGKP